MVTYHVGPHHSFRNINSALALASTGDTILIEEGVYHEHIFMDNKIVNLIGRTDHPLENKVEIIGYSSQGTTGALHIKWESAAPIDLLVESLCFKSDDDYYGIICFDGDAGDYNTSGLNVTFNKCVFDSNNFTGTHSTFYYRKYYPNQYNNLSSIYMKNCDVYLSDGRYFVYGRIRSCSSRLMENCRFNYTPRGNDSSGIYDDIFPLGSFDYTDINVDFIGYGPKYNLSLSPEYPNFYKFSGAVKEKGVPVDRELRFFRKDNDAYIGAITSSGIGGIYSMDTPYGGNHYIICLDHPDSPYYNDLIKSNCSPEVNLPAAQTYTDNLEIINPGLEMGDLIGWNIESGSYILNTDYRHSGSYSFGTGVVSQRVDLVGHGATISGIDNENFNFHVHAWKYYYYSDHYDVNQIGTRLLDENEVEIGSAIYNYSSSSIVEEWVEDLHSRPVISGTRYVDILVSVTHRSGYYDYYNRIDDISCYLSYGENDFGCFGNQTIKYYALTNPNFIGSISGWVNEVGTAIYIDNSGYDYSGCIVFKEASTGVFSQRVDLIASGLDTNLVDLESLVFFISSQVRQTSGTGWANLGIRFLDASQTILGSDYYSPTYTNTAFERHTINRTVVSGTRYVDVLLKGHYWGIFDCVLLWSKEI